MLFYSEIITPRLQYVVAFLNHVLLDDACIINTELTTFTQYTGPKINYSNKDFDKNACWIQPVPLLFETNIRQQDILCSGQNESLIFFQTNGPLGFDILAASFYLVSRYEEYLPHKKDKYGRYAAENSLAYQQHFLHLPLVNIWLQQFKNALLKQFPDIKFKQQQFNFIPTYDIDIAWSYKHKGWWRNTGGFLRDLLKGKWAAVKERYSVLLGHKNDPYDSYNWLNQLHKKHELKPYYFFLVAPETSEYDKNISPANKALQQLIYHHSLQYPVGIHPSWQSYNQPQLMKAEIKTLSLITGKDINSSRQHFLRFTLPDTYEQLTDNAIAFEFSMGYGTCNGFRASITTPYYWYNLKTETATGLLLFPFCFMEATSLHQLQQTPGQALQQLLQLYKAVKEVEGYCIIIWHNHYLGTGTTTQEWKIMYEKFIDSIATV